ncbi:hypothetical protein BDN72DRAFT_843199 [Pluteus cervinus]|uniref:Uncharacterized protein n=1 Tax=Pluteus cervinus TaxID=181527 RepID=A0ACD3AQZ0_9AGAR|nr:hypothetical protein BDN72DRAFT_843199 [Pluteus cervinus]
MAATPSVANVDANFRHTPRHLLQRALTIAQEAVQLDANSNDPRVALPAYGRAVVLLHEVMSRAREEMGVGVDPLIAPNTEHSVDLSSMQRVYTTYLSRMEVLKDIAARSISTDTSPSN